jgi:hypothetical protein
MSDSRVRVKIEPAGFVRVIDLIHETFRQIAAGMRGVAGAVARAVRDMRNPPSPERLWIRERGRAEMAEAELWFARRIASAA